MHYWGDNWFKEHGNDFYTAIDRLEKRIKKWAKCGVCGKGWDTEDGDDFEFELDSVLPQNLDKLRVGFWMHLPEEPVK